jgi:hypothetical protein
MYGNGYALGVIVASLFGGLLEYLRRRYYQHRIRDKKQQILDRLEQRIDDKRAAFQAKRAAQLKTEYPTVTDE